MGAGGGRFVPSMVLCDNPTRRDESSKKGAMQEKGNIYPSRCKIIIVQEHYSHQPCWGGKSFQNPAYFSMHDSQQSKGYNEEVSWATY